MPHERIRRTLSLVDIAKEQAFGPVKIGAILKELGEIIGVPDYWGFGPGPKFGAYMGFGDVEVHFEATDNEVRVYYAELRMVRIKRNPAKLVGDNCYDNEILLAMPQRRHQTFKKIENLMAESGISFTTEFRTAVKDETGAVINAGTCVKCY
jgi:hypothetical protein